MSVLDAIALTALIDGAWIAAAVIGSIGVFLGALTLRDCGSAMAAVLKVLAAVGTEERII